MSVLYRAYRPKHFDDVVGQPHIKAALQNALAGGKVGHAYIFSGPRGSGKTTVARLFAKSANCLEPQKDGNPCNSCDNCLEILGGSAVDVIEIDAASNRGIDEIRELRERVNFAPVKTKYKIYIIDEVHMLTREAFNALLKTLEEPPAHAIFILATTELHKVPDTILSRCQRFHFHRASDSELAELLEKVAKAEKIKLEQDALAVLIGRSEGSYRDGLSLLGSLAGRTEKITADELRTAFGLPAQEIINSLAQAIDSGQPAQLRDLLVSALDEGLDLIVLAKVLADTYKMRILNGDNKLDIGRDATALEQILLALGRSRYSSDPTGAVVARLVAVASRASQLGVAPVLKTAELEAPKQMADIRQGEPSQPPAVEKKAEKENVDPVTAPPKPVEGSDEFWSALLHEIKQRNHALYMLLKSAALLDLTDTKVLIGVRFRFYSERLFEAKNRKLLELSAEKISGKKLVLECEVRSDLDSKGANEEDLLNAVVDVFELEEA